MPRVTLTAQAAPGGYGVGVTGLVLTETAADVGNFQQTPATGKELIIAHNTDSSSHTVTITSAPDAQGRSGDIAAFSIAANAIAVFGPFPTGGWQQTDGKLYYQANSALVKFGVLTLP